MRRALPPVLPPAPSPGLVAAAAERPWRRALRSRRTAVAAAVVVASLVVPPASWRARRRPATVPDVDGRSWPRPAPRSRRPGLEPTAGARRRPARARPVTCSTSHPRPAPRSATAPSCWCGVASGQPPGRRDVTGLELRPRGSARSVAQGLVPSRGTVVRADGDGTVVDRAPRRAAAGGVDRGARRRRGARGDGAGAADAGRSTARSRSLRRKPRGTASNEPNRAGTASAGDQRQCRTDQVVGHLLGRDRCRASARRARTR